MINTSFETMKTRVSLKSRKFDKMLNYEINT